MDKTITYYSKHAESLREQYDSLTFEQVHGHWLAELPSEGMVLDVGAGSGRDARHLAAKGLNVVAVEPADGLREQAQRYHAGPPIHWLDDSLPELNRVHKLQTKFDLILLSAVWMHIPKSQRQRSFRKLSSLLKPNGKMVVSLRHGASTDERTMHSVSADELAQLAQNYGLSYQLLTSPDDQLQRPEVHWETVLLRLPDDGTGAFPLIRNIVVNDAKASTYKVGLLRTLLRIAEGHPGAVLEQTEHQVSLPMGLVALYWLKLYKPLLDHYDIQQSSSRSGLGFVKANGWDKIRSINSNDFYIGACYLDTTTAQDIYRTLKDIASVIKNMPARYITLPGTKNEVFHVELERTQKPSGPLVLDHSFLTSLGRFYVPRDIWDALARFSIWIEPALVNEWSQLMASYQSNQTRFSATDYLQALSWEHPERTTSRVRKRVEQVLQSDSVQCCWSGRAIQRSGYAIDHAFPFARWPNNDLWNLLPTKPTINSAKSDKLPSTQTLRHAKELILHWWRQGWGEAQQDEFFTQANFALPNLSPKNRNFDDVFEAFALQRDRIKHLQQLQDWQYNT